MFDMLKDQMNPVKNPNATCTVTNTNRTVDVTKDNNASLPQLPQNKTIDIVTATQINDDGFQ